MWKSSLLSTISPLRSTIFLVLLVLLFHAFCQQTQAVFFTFLLEQGIFSSEDYSLMPRSRKHKQQKIFRYIETCENIYRMVMVARTWEAAGN